jgi:branched-chain amino acid transport system substrate-binding protein
MEAFDRPALNGAQIAVDEINAAGGVLGRQLEIVTADTKSDIDEGTLAGLDVIDQGAEVMIVSPDYNMGGGAARAAQEAGMLVFSSSAGSPKFGIEGIGPLAFTMGISATTDGAVAAEWGVEDKGFQTAYILLDDCCDYNKDQCRGFEPRWRKLGGTVVGEDTFLNSDLSITAQVSRILALETQPDLIMLCSFPPGGAVAVKQLRDAGVDAPIISNNGFDGDFWYKDSMPDLKDFFYTSPVSLWGNDPSDQVNTFVAKYVEREGQPQAVSSIGAYATVYAMARAIEQAGSTDGAALAAVLETFDRENVGGLFVSFTPEAHIDANREERIMELNAGQHSVAAVRSAEEQLPLTGG